MKVGGGGLCEICSQKPRGKPVHRLIASLHVHSDVGIRAVRGRDEITGAVHSGKGYMYLQLHAIAMSAKKSPRNCHLIWFKGLAN